MFRGRPDIQTKGRYYFNDGAPHYDGLHYFGSANWTKGEVDEQPPLGEVISDPWRWYNGRGPERRPLPQRVGSVDCLSLGEEFLQPIPEREIIDGIDSRCFSRLGEADTTTGGQMFCALDQPALQVAMMRMLELVYDEDFATVRNAVQAATGQTMGFQERSVRGVIPAYLFMRLQDGTNILLITGTSTFQQFALQAFVGLTGPMNFGAYGTNGVWNHTASFLFDELKFVLADKTKPLIVAGHSYGAAVAAVMAARIKAYQPLREICAMTFGIPKAGDARFMDLYEQTRHIEIATTGDLICALPPNLLELLPFAALLPPGLLGFWSRWERLPSYIFVRGDGSTFTAAPPFSDYAILAPLIADAIAGDPLPGITAHFPDEYRKRLKFAQPTPAWPINTTAWNILFP